ncbi:MAG: hypothetical protein HY271_04440 [Deltaproteobacteria bacterium]|nr:hypothetical protein [Deltaproteobacteria bacterium]
MTEDIRELREKVLALAGTLESRKAKYRLLEMEERLTELSQTSSESKGARENPPSS